MTERTRAEKRRKRRARTARAHEFAQNILVHLEFKRRHGLEWTPHEVDVHREALRTITPDRVRLLRLERFGREVSDRLPPVRWDAEEVGSACDYHEAMTDAGSLPPQPGT